MIVNYLSSYDRSFKKLDPSIQEKTISAIDSLLEFIETRKKPEGLGLKKLYKDYWEIRLDIRNRIIFELKGEILNIAFVGDHNEVKRFIKNV